MTDGINAVERLNIDDEIGLLVLKITKKYLQDEDIENDMKKLNKLLEHVTNHLRKKQKVQMLRCVNH